MSLRETIERSHPEASKTHRWVPEYGDDNVECSYCSVRPYNEDAKKPCPYEPSYFDAEQRASSR